LFERPRSGENAVLVRIGIGEPASEQDVNEFTALAISAGAKPVATISGMRRRPDARLFVGSGKAEEVRDAVVASGADVVLFDHPLTPSQERNLEKLIGRRVLDRNGLILDIFAQRARSFEGKLEVELAQLKHLATRLVRGWTARDRPAPAGQPHPHAEPAAREAAEAARHGAAGAPRRACADGRDRRLHQRR
jgi:GTPase